MTGFFLRRSTGDHHSGSSRFLRGLRSIAAIREHSGTARRNAQNRIRAGKATEVPDIGKMRDQKRIQAALPHPKTQRAEPTGVVHSNGHG